MIGFQPHIHRITHETGQGTYRFFEKFGFVTLRIDPDPLGIGIDFHQMEKRLLPAVMTATTSTPSQSLAPGQAY